MALKKHFHSMLAYLNLSPDFLRNSLNATQDNILCRQDCSSGRVRILTQFPNQLARQAFRYVTTRQLQQQLNIRTIPPADSLYDCRACPLSDLQDYQNDGQLAYWARPLHFR